MYSLISSFISLAYLQTTHANTFEQSQAYWLNVPTSEMTIQRNTTIQSYVSILSIYSIQLWEKPTNKAAVRSFVVLN